MITVEEFAAIHIEMAMAMGNREKEQAICQSYNISMEEWDEGKAFYYAKMADPADGGKTAAAMSNAAINGISKVKLGQPVAKADPLPADFTASEIRIYMSEFNILMVEFGTSQPHCHIVLQHDPRPDPADEFLANYVKGRPHISINEQSYSIYGGVSSIELKPGSATFIFDPEGAERMQTASVKVDFTVSPKKYLHLSWALANMYGDMVKVQPLGSNDIFTMGDLLYNLSWDTFSSRNATVRIRPNLENIKATGRYATVVTPSFQKGTTDAATEKEWFTGMLHSMEAVMEDDAHSLLGFYTEDESKYQFFIYTSLDQNSFMQTVNHAFVYLPQLPLAFSGGEDAAWNNYAECMKDYAAAK